MSLVALANINESKPSALIALAATRAHFWESLSHLLSSQKKSGSAFLFGLLSLIDAMLDDQIESLLMNLPLENAIKRALIDGSGPFAEYLHLVSAYEKGDWDTVGHLVRQLGTQKNTVARCYTDAVSWVDSTDFVRG